MWRKEQFRTKTNWVLVGLLSLNWQRLYYREKIIKFLLIIGMHNLIYTLLYFKGYHTIGTVPINRKPDCQMETDKILKNIGRDNKFVHDGKNEASQKCSAVWPIEIFILKSRTRISKISFYLFFILIINITLGLLHKSMRQKLIFLVEELLFRTLTKT